RRAHVAVHLEQPCDALGVVLVHLTAVRADEVGLAHGTIVSGGRRYDAAHAFGALPAGRFDPPRHTRRRRRDRRPLSDLTDDGWSDRARTERRGGDRGTAGRIATSA